MIVFDKVSKTFPNGVRAVRELSMEVAEGETLILLGTSGSGKTTSMKMVNRLIEPTGGRILVDGRDIMDCDPIDLRRSIGYAIQHIGLFPHMSVADNIEVAPRLLKWDSARRRERTERLLSMVGLDPAEFGGRFPNELSGGQRQRVGVARALAADPPIVLMDEPFGALDPITREQLQAEFKELEAEIRKTILFVTHDVFEAVKMGDRIALMDEGRLQQLASPAELVERPANEFVDNFLGQHRFQLALMTRTIRSIAAAPGPDVAAAGESLRAGSSLVQALDTFKASGRDALPVYDKGALMGSLGKKELLDAIAGVLGETGGAQ